MQSEGSNPFSDASRKDRIFNMLSVLLLIVLGIVIIVFLVFFTNPSAVPASFQLPTLPSRLVLPSPTTTEVQYFPPTWTVTPAEIQGIMTNTPLPPQLGVTVIPQQTSTLEPTVAGGYPFQLQGDPTGMKSTIFKPNSNCSWLGVAGNVYDLQGRPVQGIIVQMGGSYNYQKIQEAFTLTGLARSYGESGYEFTIANVITQSSRTIWIQLVDQAAIPLSAKIYFDTYADCNRNLILINFKQVR
jgi:hypothetical protein